MIVENTKTEKDITKVLILIGCKPFFLKNKGTLANKLVFFVYLGYSSNENSFA
jgi:hypothetical protein